MKRRSFLRGLLAACAAPATAAAAVVDVLKTSKPIRRLRWCIVETQVEYWADPKAEQMLIDAMAEHIQREIEKDLIGRPNNRFTRSYAKAKINDAYYETAVIKL